MAVDDPNPSNRPSDAELARIIRTGSDPSTQGHALTALVDRAPRSLGRTLVSVTGNTSLDPGVRAMALGALTRRPTPSAIEAIRTAVEDDQPLVAQRAIERLGKVGTADDLDLLGRLPVGDRATERLVRSAKEFLSYRHRLGAFTLSVPRSSLAATSQEATTIETGAPSAGMRRTLELQPARVPGLDLEPMPIRRIACGHREFGLHLATAYRGPALASVVEQQGLPAVLTLRNPETGRFEAAYYLMTDPVRRGRCRIAGVRSSGRVAVIGTGRIEGEVFHFEFNATELPIDHPLTITGSVDLTGERIRIDRATVEPRFSPRQQQRRRQPRAVTAPRR